MYKKEYNFIGNYKFIESKFEYSLFEILAVKSGYKLCKDLNQHYFYDWDNMAIESITVRYNLTSIHEIKKYYIDKFNNLKGVLFYVRVLHHLPLLIIEFSQLIEMFEDLKYETDMGWEAISICGNYIIEFTDKYKSEIKINHNPG